MPEVAVDSSAIASPELDTGLAKVKAVVDAIQVTDHNSCLKAKLARVFVRERWLKPLETMNKRLMLRIRDFEWKEREAADEEALKLNRERAEQDEAPIEVEPNIPSVAGAPSRVPTVPKLTPAKLQQLAEAVADGTMKLYTSHTTLKKLRAIIVAQVLQKFQERA